MVTTKRGTPCPVCQEGETENVAVLPLGPEGEVTPREGEARAKFAERWGADEAVTPPHEYSVCAACFERQVAVFQKVKNNG